MAARGRGGCAASAAAERAGGASGEVVPRLSPGEQRARRSHASAPARAGASPPQGWRFLGVLSICSPYFGSTAAVQLLAVPGGSGHPLVPPAS